MDRTERESLLLRIGELQTEIGLTTEELERASANLYAPRIRDLEEELSDTRRRIVELRRSIASSSVRRWQRWPTSLIVLTILIVVVARECH